MLIVDEVNSTVGGFHWKPSGNLVTIFGTIYDIASPIASSFTIIFHLLLQIRMKTFVKLSFLPSQENRKINCKSFLVFIDLYICRSFIVTIENKTQFVIDD